MLICKKKRCIWRVYCGEGKYYCHKAGNCPNVMTAKEKLPKGQVERHYQTQKDA